MSPRFRRFWLVSGVAAFMASFHLVYFVWLNPVYGYMGFSYPESMGLLTVLGYCFGIGQAFFMPIELTRPSQFLHWMIYLIVFLPSMLILSFVSLRPESEVMRLQVVLLLGMMLIGMSYHFRIKKITRIAIAPAVFWSGLAIAVAAFMIWVVVVYWGHFQFVAWDKTYESLRFTGSDIADAAGLNYPINWLGMVFLPFFSAIALLQKRPWLFAITMTSDLLLYMTQGMKHILFASVYILVIFFLLNRREKTFGLRIVWALTLFFVIFYFYVHFCDDARSGLAMLFGANVVMRVFGAPGFILGAYQNFFVDHPLTYYSHVTGINWVVVYPYQRALGLEVGFATAGATDYDMNGSFWATDGLASIGLPGIMAISLVIACVFYWLDCVSSSHKASAIALCLSQYALVLTNVSFFTSLVTGGLFWFFLIFYLMPAGIGAPRIVPARKKAGQLRLGPEKSLLPGAIPDR